LNGKKIKEAVVILNDKSKTLTEKLQLDLKITALLVTATKSEAASGGSLFNIFLLGFVGGLLALLTPCVFPMITLTVSFFTKQSQSKSKGILNAVLNGHFIVCHFSIFLFILFWLLRNNITKLLGN
jgi:thiol:disulfide interchange protein DsbD